MISKLLGGPALYAYLALALVASHSATYWWAYASGHGYAELVCVRAQLEADAAYTAVIAENQSKADLASRDLQQSREKQGELVNEFRQDFEKFKAGFDRDCITDKQLHGLNKAIDKANQLQRKP